MSGPADSSRPDADADAVIPERVLMTGAPCFSARRIAARILSEDADARLVLLVADCERADTEVFLAELPEDQSRRVELLFGAVERMDLGLSGAEYRRLGAEITTIHHLAGIADTTCDASVARAVNIEGTRNVIELAAETSQLRRLCHYSTTDVSGKLRGVFSEHDLECGQSFHNPYEETHYRAEILARRAQRRLPVSIFRLGILVGDSKTGEIDRFDGPYYLMVAMVTNPSQAPLPAPNLSEVPLNLVPVDFVAAAAYALSVDERAAGRTFHLIDPYPVSARRVYELVARCSRTRPPRTVIPNRLARFLLRVPGVERATRGQRFFLDELDNRALYRCDNTLEVLAHTDIRCPPFESYVETLVRYVQACHPLASSTGADDADEFVDALDPEAGSD